MFEFWRRWVLLKQFISALVIYSFLFQIYPIFAVDELYKFSSQYIPERVEYEKKRNLCIFPFRSKVGAEQFTYLSKGLAEVTYSALNGFKYVFDSEPLEDVFIHTFGTPKKDISSKNKKPSLDQLNSGEKKVIVEEDPRYIRLIPKLIEGRPILLEEALGEGKKNACYYILTGEFQSTGSDSLRIDFELTERKNGSTQKFSENTTIKRAFQDWQARADVLKVKLLGKAISGVSISTGDINEAYVYLDGEYIGKSPVKRSDLTAGKHKILISKDGYERIENTIELDSGKIYEYTFAMTPILSDGFLSVHSEPQGANVYLGSKFLGETPLENVPVPTGVNRLRIIKEDHIDYFQGLDIKKGKTIKVKARLKEGNTEVYYKNRFNVFLDYNYFDFALYSLFATTVFYGVYMYSGLRIDEDRDRLQSFLPVTNFVLLGQLSTIQSTDSTTVNSYLSTLMYQQTQVNKTNVNIVRYESFQQASIYGAATMLTLTGVFLYLGLSSDGLEFGYTPIKTQNGNGYDANIKYTFRF